MRNTEEAERMKHVHYSESSSPVAALQRSVLRVKSDVMVVSVLWLQYVMWLLNNEKWEVSKGKTTSSSISVVPLFPRSPKRNTTHQPIAGDTCCSRVTHSGITNSCTHLTWLLYFFLTQNMIFSSNKPKVLIPEPHQADGQYVSWTTGRPTNGLLVQWDISLTTEMSE